MKKDKPEVGIEKKAAARLKAQAELSESEDLVNAQGKKVSAYADDVAKQQDEIKRSETEQERRIAEAEEQVRRAQMQVEQAQLQAERESINVQKAQIQIQQLQFDLSRAEARIAELEKQLNESKKQEPKPTQPTPIISSGSETKGDMSEGSIIEFGSYPQDENGTRKPIEWVVLKKEDNAILVISKYVLDCIQYNSTIADVTWETSTLRKWLNEDFYNTAFGASERAVIKKTNVRPHKNPKYNTNSGNATSDNIFLLSVREANLLFTSDKARRCSPTDYALSRGTYISLPYTVEGKQSCFWWLRTPGEYQNYASFVNYNGSPLVSNKVTLDFVAVRPALWINLI